MEKETKKRKGGAEKERERKKKKLKEIVGKCTEHSGSICKNKHLNRKPNDS